MGMQYYLLSAVVGAAAVVVAIMFVTHPRTIRTCWDRACTGRAWKRAFPRASKAETRNFLYVFVDAFAFPRKRALQFAPTDQVLSVYRALYPIKGWPDALELETFALRVEKTYGVEFRSIWRDDLTMGEIFERSLPQHS
jgi:propanediol dehydratase small subunit